MRSPRIVCVAWFISSIHGVLLDREPNEHHNVLSEWQMQMDEALSRPGPLSGDEVRSYFEDGFVLVKSVLEQEIMDLLREDVNNKQMEFARMLMAEGKLSGSEESWMAVPWDEKLLRMQEEYADASVLFAKNGKLSPAFQKLYTQDRVLEMAKQLGVPAGDDGALAIHPAWNLRGKMPNHGETEVPWHQDNSYWEPRLWKQQIFTAWVPLVDATLVNGCMEYIRGSHVRGRTITHTCCLGNTWYTETDLETARAELEMPDAEDRAVLVPAQAGDMIFFGPTVLHRSIPNRGDTIRWSADLRWHEVGGQAQPAPSNISTSPLDWFYGLKDSLVIREGGKPVLQGLSAMDEWANVDRSEVQEAGLKTKAALDLDPIVTGPWMDLWDITHRNRHVDRYLDSLTPASSLRAEL